MLTIDFQRLAAQDSRQLHGRRFLDIGSGPGRHAGAALSFEQTTVIAADLNFDDLVKARANLQEREKNGYIRGKWLTLSADITCLPFPDHYFDVVICAEVLEHIHNQHAAVEQIIRVLKPSGLLVVSVPRYLPERICWLLSKEYHTNEGGHIRIYKQKQLIVILEKAGVQVWDFHFAHSLHTPYWWLKCLSRRETFLVKLYHRLLVWDMLKGPALTRLLEKILNPVIGKSLVVYCRKNN